MAQLPVPVIIGGEAMPLDHVGYWPGDPLPPHLYVDGDSRKYVYNAKREAYTPDTIHVLPVQMILPNGERRPVELPWWYPGDPYTPFRQNGTWYHYDKHRGLYARHDKITRQPRLSSTLALCLVLSWWYATPFGVIVGGNAGSGPRSGLIPGFLTYLFVYLAVAFTVYSIRSGRAEAHNSRCR